MNFIQSRRSNVTGGLLAVTHYNVAIVTENHLRFLLLAAILRANA